MSRRRVNQGAVLTYQYGLPVLIRHDYKERRDHWIERYVVQSVEYAAKFFKKGSSVLDIGCAYGYAVHEFNQRGFKAEGVDKFPVHGIFDDVKLTQGSFYQLEDIFKKGSVGNLFINHTLEHAGELFRFLHQCVMILKKGGCVYVAVPHIDDEWAWDFRDSTTHYAGFNEKFLESVWKRYGFKTLALQTVELLPHRKPPRREIWYVGRRIKTYDSAYERMIREAKCKKKK